MTLERRPSASLHVSFGSALQSAFGAVPAFTGPQVPLVPDAFNVSTHA